MTDDQTTPATPEDAHKPGEAPQPSQKRKDEMQDEALEDTFPASDPVAPKHIT